MPNQVPIFKAFINFILLKHKPLHNETANASIDSAIAVKNIDKLLKIITLYKIYV